MGLVPGLLVWTLAASAVAGFAMPLRDVLALAAVFAGLPSILVSGGIARGVARRRLEGASAPAVWTAGVLATAVAGVGLTLLVAVPARALPFSPADWWTVLVAGLVAGSLTGALVTAVALATVRSGARAS